MSSTKSVWNESWSLHPRGDCERPCFDQLNAHIFERLLFCWRSKICACSWWKHGRLQSPLVFNFQSNYVSLHTKIHEPWNINFKRRWKFDGIVSFLRFKLLCEADTGPYFLLWSGWKILWILFSVTWLSLMSSDFFNRLDLHRRPGNRLNVFQGSHIITFTITTTITERKNVYT